MSALKRDKELLAALVEQGYMEPVGSSWKWTAKGYQISRLARLAIEKKVDKSIAPQGMDISLLEQAGFNSITCKPN